MSARQRMRASFINFLTILGIGLILTVGFPFLTIYMSIPLEEMPGMEALDAIGYYLLRATPIILILLFLYNLVSVKYRQKKINNKMQESVSSKLYHTLNIWLFLLQLKPTL